MCWNLCCWIWSIPVLSFRKLVTCITTSPLIWCALPCTSSHQEWFAFDTNICFGRRYFLIKYIFCLAPHLIRSDSPMIQTFVLPGDILWLNILCLALRLIRTDLLSNICLPLSYLRPLFWCVDCQMAVRGDKTCIWTLHGMHHRSYTHEQFRLWALQVESFVRTSSIISLFPGQLGRQNRGPYKLRYVRILLLFYSVGHTAVCVLLTPFSICLLISFQTPALFFFLSLMLRAYYSTPFTPPPPPRSWGGGGGGHWNNLVEFVEVSALRLCPNK